MLGRLRQWRRDQIILTYLQCAFLLAVTARLQILGLKIAMNLLEMFVKMPALTGPMGNCNTNEK